MDDAERKSLVREMSRSWCTLGELNVLFWRQRRNPDCRSEQRKAEDLLYLQVKKYNEARALLPEARDKE